MPNIRSAEKRRRTSLKRRDRNKSVMTYVRNSVKRCRLAIAGQDNGAIEQSFKSAVSALDRAASKGVIHKNAASRIQSRLAKTLKKSAS